MSIADSRRLLYVEDIAIRNYFDDEVHPEDAAIIQEHINEGC
jgi:hypothetical protein